MTTYPTATHASAHLTWDELGCKDGTPYPDEWRASRGAELAQAFEAVREAAGGKPIAILSAYRTPAHNRRIGGAPHSQHVEGQALDLRPPHGMTVQAFYALIRTVADEGTAGIGGVGLYRTFVHIDIRDAPRLVAWNGGAQRKDDRA